jgi:hypothetical protein
MYTLILINHRGIRQITLHNLAAAKFGADLEAAWDTTRAALVLDAEDQMIYTAK